MSNLIITILGIVLFVVLSVSGVMYVDSRSVSVRENEYLVKSGINQLVSDYHVYKVRRKESLPVNNWSSFIEVPRTPANMSWSYGSKPEGMYFCLSGEIKDRYFYEDTIKILEDSFNSVVVSNTCGETSNNKNFMLGDAKAYTVWVDSTFISEGSDIENSNVYDFQVKMIEVETGKEIKLHDNLILHKGYDFLIDIEISDSSVKSTVEPVSDFEADFICLDNSKGCNNGLKRRLRVKSTSLFMDRDLILDFENSKGKVRKIIHLKSIAAFQCDALDPLANFDKSGDFYLIGGTQGYKVDAKLQLLCLSQNQTPEVLNAKYRLMSDIDFDIKHNLTKTYQNVQAVENINQTESYPFIKSISSTVTSNGEDWNGDGAIDDINTEGWMPLGDFSNGSKQFSGEFDGNNHYIKNIYSKRTAGFQGLFGATHTNFKVYDLQVLDSYIESSGDQIGLLSGEADGATISNCYVSGNLVGKISNYAGGLIGHVDASSKISNVHVHADVVVNSNASAYVGEVIGNLLNGSTLSQASANGDVFAKANTHAFVGGLVGGFATSLSNSYSLGSVYGYALNNYAMVGGISGWNTQNNLTIDNCYSKAHVGAYTSKSISSAGGLYGDDNLGGLIINNSYATGKVLSYSVDGPARAGGLAGGMNATNSEINNSYAYWEVAPNAYSVNSSKANGGLIGVSPAVINNANNICEYVSESTPTKCTKANIAYMQSSIKANWSDDIWEDLSNETPKLEWEVKGDVNSVFSWGCNPSNPLGGMEKEIVGIDEYYLIGGSMGSSARAKEHLLCLSQNQNSEVLNSNYKLTADITFDNDFSISKKYQDINNNISSIKDEKHPFLQNITVTLSSNNEDWDGDRVIDGLNTEGFIPLGNYADDSSNLFKGKFEGGNHSITNLYINRDSKNYQGLFGDIVGPGEVKNLNIVNAYIRGKDSIGILSGRLYSANVNNVKTDGHIKSRGSSGGIIGTMDSNAKISSSNSDVYIYSNEDADSQFIGGIVGSSFNSTLSNNKSSGDLLAIGSIAGKYNWGGGITGYLRNTTVDGCSSSVNVFSANPTASHGFAGGISGGSYASSKILNSNSSGNVASVNNYVGGIIGYSNSSSIENCHATGDIEGKIYYVGGLVGYAYNTVNFKNSYATGNVTGNNNYVGGAVGRAFKSNLENIYATGNVIGNGSYIGGMAGSLSNDSSASDCYAEGSVKNNKNYHTGGLIGGISNNSTVSGCYSKGQVSTVNHYAGGLIGYANGSTISDSYSESIVLAPGKNYVGGLIGYANGATINSSYAVGNVLGAYNVGGLIGPIRGSTVKNTYAKGKVVGSSSNVGGLIGGFADSNTLENSYAIGDVVGSGYKNGALVGGLYSSSGSLIIKKSYAVNTSLTAIGDRVFDKYNYCSVGVDKDCDITYNPYSIKDAWDDNIWEDLFEEVPKLEWQEDGDISSGYAWSCNSADPLSNIDIDSGYYMIGGIKGNAALAKKQLVCLSNNQNYNVLSSNYKLTANIDFKENPSEEDWNGDDSPDGSSTNGWSPIGYNSSNRFVGAFDGQGHYIKNLYISSTGDNKGLFGLVSGAIIKDLGLSNVNIKGRTNIGALAGHITKSTSSVSGVLVKGSISARGNNTGGLIGNVNSGVSVLNSYSVTNISSTGSYIGGLVGKISNNSKIIDSYSLSIVSGGSIVGGLLGGSVASSSSQATITNSYAYWSTAPKGSSRIGGLVGSSDNILLNNNSDKCEYVDEYTPTSCPVAELTYEYGKIKSGWSDGVWENLSDLTPKLEWEVAGDIKSVISGTWFCDALNPVSNLERDADGYYLIGGSLGDSDLAKKQFLCLSNYQNKASLENVSYKLKADINFNVNPALEDWDGDGSPDGTSADGWFAFGFSSNVRFKNSVFDGEGNKINNLYMNNSYSNQGLFGYVLNSTVKNIALVNANITALNNVGSLVGNLKGSIIEKSFSSGTIKGNGNKVGSLIGRAYANSKIYDSYSFGIVSGSVSIGGLIGSLKNGSHVYNSYSKAKVSGTKNVAGVIGSSTAKTSNRNSVTNSYSYWSIKPVGNSNIGGLIGRTTNTYINNPYDLCEYLKGESRKICTSDNVFDIHAGEGVYLDFDGSDDYISLPLFDQSSIIKMRATGKFNSINNKTYETIVASISSSSGVVKGAWLGYNGISGKFKAYIGDSSNYVETSSTYSLNGVNYYDVEVRVSGGNFAIWVNGEKNSIDKSLETVNNPNITRIAKGDGVSDDLMAGKFAFVELESSNNHKVYFANENGKFEDLNTKLEYNNSGSGSLTVTNLEGWDSGIWNDLKVTPTPTLKVIYH